MIPLPPGCKVTYSVWIDIDSLTDDILEWFINIGGQTKSDEYYDNRGRRKIQHFVRYGNGKWCYHHSGGIFGTRLHFDGKDVSIATMFLLKYMEKVRQHNMQETLERYERDNEKSY